MWGSRDGGGGGHKKSLNTLVFQESRACRGGCWVGKFKKSNKYIGISRIKSLEGWGSIKSLKILHILYFCMVTET